MKTLFLTIALFATQLTATFAAEVRYLTKDEYISLMRQNVSVYEEVSLGTTIKFTDTFTTYTNEVLTATCFPSGQATVMATTLTHYLVYNRLTMNTDCDLVTDGETVEFLSWRKIMTIEDHELFINNELFDETITQLNEDTILITGKTTDTETSKRITYKKVIRLGFSQFSATVHVEEGDYKYTNYGSWTLDTRKIDISHLLLQQEN
jgi:hypothetical protein